MEPPNSQRNTETLHQGSCTICTAQETLGHSEHNEMKHPMSSQMTDRHIVRLDLQYHMTNDCVTLYKVLIAQSFVATIFSTKPSFLEIHQITNVSGTHMQHTSLKKAMATCHFQK